MKTIPALRPITPAVAEEVRRLIAEQTHVPAAWDALQIWGTIGRTVVLKTNGTLMISTEGVSEEDETPVELTDPGLQLEAMVVGSRRWPLLKDMLPERPADAAACTSCRSTGDMWPESEHLVLCITCNGLGWYLDE
ncbi:MAG: hypothetical protein Q7N87_01135 [Candidatus Uhrbacteria bacterium]|nr:hypothetical protein [Candidatus Uhrbacteria bacterium]